MRKNHSVDFTVKVHNPSDRFIDFDFQCETLGVNAIRNPIFDRTTEFQGQEKLDQDISRFFALQQADVFAFGEDGFVIDDLEEDFSSFEQIVVATIGEEVVRSIHMPSDITEIATLDVIDSFDEKKIVPYVSDDPYGDEIVGFQVQTAQSLLSYVYYRNVISKSNFSQSFRGRLDFKTLYLLTPVLLDFTIDDLGITDIVRMVWNPITREILMNCSKGLAFYKDDRRFVVERDLFIKLEVVSNLVYTRDGIPLFLVSLDDGCYEFVLSRFMSSSCLILDVKLVGKTSEGLGVYLRQTGKCVQRSQLMLYQEYKEILRTAVSFEQLMEYDFDGSLSLLPFGPVCFERQVLRENFNSFNFETNRCFKCSCKVMSSVEFNQQSSLIRVLPVLATRLSRSPYLSIERARLLQFYEQYMKLQLVYDDPDSEFVFLRSRIVSGNDLYFYHSQSGFYSRKGVVRDLNYYRKLESRKIRFDILNLEFSSLYRAHGVVSANRILKENIVKLFGTKVYNHVCLDNKENLDSSKINPCMDPIILKSLQIFQSQRIGYDDF